MATSIKQRKQLGIVATRAFNFLHARGQIVLPADVASCSKSQQAEFWRHQQTSMALMAAGRPGKCSFKELIKTQQVDEYRIVKMWFESIVPADQPKALHTAERDAANAACTRSPGCEYVRQSFAAISDAGQKPGYFFAIMKGKFGKRYGAGVKKEDLTERDLQQLMFTILNRMMAIRGKGETANRDKTQRASRKNHQPLMTDLPAAEKPSGPRNYTVKMGSAAPKMMPREEPADGSVNPF